MSRRLVILLALTACARGGTDETVIDGPLADAKKIDAPPIDSSTTSGTCTQAFTGTLATWTFTAETGNQASTAVATKANGITAGAVTRAAALTAVTGAGSINSANWPLTAMRDVTKYYAFTIAPPTGCTLSLTSIALDARSSGTGPVSASTSTSADNYAATATVSTTVAGTVALAVMNATGMVEVRVHGFAASATGGTMRLQTTLSVDGQLK